MKFGNKIAAMGLGISALVLSMAGTASAHVTVKPGEATTASYQTFTVSVPVEKDMPTVGLKLDIPKGVQSVTPTVKPGWTIASDKQGSGHDATTLSITWSNGSIPAGYRDEFTFNAKTPDTATELQWKAHQTYEDGSVVEWTLPANKESKDDEASNSGPFSVTKVTAQTPQDIGLKNADTKAQNAQHTASTALWTGIGGILLALAGIYFATRKP
ncbi:MAG TPA: YcnI family protein [Nevskiaceae bacterium]|nr:YcnI family protein [Nevskiaceae bacterium]